MKKLMGLVLALAAFAFVGSSAKARTNGAPAGQVIRVEQGRHRQDRWNNRWNNRWNRRARVVTQTRIVQRGRQRFRETYQVVYRPNGRTDTRLISRVRIG